MTDINKQKFLTELGKLLTFMYEEDRCLALSIYDEVFEQAEDEQSVLSALVSPTRQAVIIARAYNAKERKLQIHSQSRDDKGYYTAGDEVPDFVLAIEDAVPFEFTYVPQPLCQDSMQEFEESDDVQGEQEPENDSSVSEQTAHEEEPETEQSVAEEVHKEKAQETQVSEETQEAEASEAASQVSEQEKVRTESSVEEAAEENTPEETAEEKTEAETEKDTKSAAESDTEDKEENDEPKAQSEPSEEETEETCVQDAEVKPAPAEALQEEEESEEEDSVSSYETVSKPRIFLLILYIIFAVPITAAGILLLLIPTLLSLALAVAFISAGSVLLAATFSGFAVFADIMVMLGAALIVLALGLLVLWLFIWFIGGAMASLVHSVLELAHKWCYKEVPAV